MTLPEVYAFSKYWQYNPPVHVAVAAYLGIKPEEVKTGSMNDLMRELQMVSGG